MAKVVRRQASGRFLLRIAPGLHAALRTAARASKVSLNDYCARKLAAPIGALAALPPGAAVVERAGAACGASLLGVVVYGSWARGEATPRSDVDVLIVLDGDTPPSRALYRAWDAEDPPTWEGRPVEPHFACLPEPSEAISGLWAEVATDGVVLLEQELRVSAHLAHVRREIVSGRIVRRFSHGQPYWSLVA
ncbi:MAG: toxin-antitoxin system HicB family antitoxin [Deltaproteobacteria bacterium]|nr:toxin-antitoxin system HicB family antitoxin [Deltaproteobacteria bacterium]